MYYLLTFVFSLWICRSDLVSGKLNSYDIKNELQELNATTCESDSCADRYGDSLSSYSCNCDSSCVQLDTCCLDSYYFDVERPKLKHTCRTVHGSSKTYFMVDRCPSSGSIWDNLCEDEWNGESEVMKIVPVTSLSTLITYKNYFCFRCNEPGDEIYYWNVVLESTVSPEERPDETKPISLTYDQDTWMASYGRELNVPVNLSVTLPSEVFKLVKTCYPNIISSCPEGWSDADIADKCLAYMAFRESVRTKLQYRNVYCALCNSEEQSDIYCKPSLVVVFSKEIFSFTHLLDINRSDGDKVGKIRRCDDEHMWDPYTKQCRKLTCALPGYKILNGKCTKF